MSLVPIGSGHEHDLNYRYKMPRLINKVEGRGNGIKTAIPNMPEIAKALHVHPRYPTKFFGMELGALSKYTEETERAIVNGAHTAQDLAVILDKFIQLFVLCPTCKLPEIKWVVRKNTFDVDCAACGFNGRLPTSHRLKDYVMKHDGPKSGREKRSVKDKRKERQQRVEVQEGSSSSQKKVSAAASDDAEGGHDDWFTDTSTKAQDARRQEEFAEMKVAEGVDDELAKLLQQARVEGGQMAPANVLRLFLAEKERTPREVADEARRLQLSRGFDDSALVKTLMDALINTADPATVPAQFKQHAPIFQQFCETEQSAKTFMNRVEELVGVTCVDLMPRTPMILQAVNEFVSDEVILQWANSAAETSWLVRRDIALAVRKAGKIFTDWLAESEDEDDEGDSSEEED